MAKRRNPCIFCGTYENPSGEHLFSDWFNEIFPQDSVVSTHSRCDVDNPDSNFGPRTWTAHQIANKEIYNVCVTCNTGWMSSIDGSTKPILVRMFGDQRAQITPAEQELLAAWTLLKSAVWDNASAPDGTIFGPDDLRRLKDYGSWMADNLADPASSQGTKPTLAGYDQAVILAAHQSRDVELSLCAVRLGETVHQPGAGRIRTFTFRLANVVLQARVHADTEDFRVHLGEETPKSIRIWTPKPDSIDWPTAEMTAEEFEEFEETKSFASLPPRTT
ncbi:MAG: hypothetical protein M0Z92_03500 [Actinomycetota bacterium]|nr:hypothetical protein [Actinomycetota bacterium]